LASWLRCLFRNKRKPVMAVKITGRDVLLVVDVQNDFCPGGALPVASGDEVVPVILRLTERFPHVVLTQDWHPQQHLSFASMHPGKLPFDTVDAACGRQTLWPDHCVQGSHGAAIHDGLQLQHAELILRKGFRPEIDSYSAFQENDRATRTGLAGYLRERGIERVFLAGLAFDYCVRFSAVDARTAGFDAVVIEDACRSIGLDGSVAATYQDFARTGVELIRSQDF
jgi:nicotinamidase/pyrazinamidase